MINDKCSTSSYNSLVGNLVVVLTWTLHVLIGSYRGCATFDMSQSKLSSWSSRSFSTLEARSYSKHPAILFSLIRILPKIVRTPFGTQKHLERHTLSHDSLVEPLATEESVEPLGRLGLHTNQSWWSFCT